MYWGNITICIYYGFLGRLAVDTRILSYVCAWDDSFFQFWGEGVGSRRDGPNSEGANGEEGQVLDVGGWGQGGKKVCRSMRRVHSPNLRTQNQQGDHMSEPNAAPVAAPASMPMASGAPAL